MKKIRLPLVLAVFLISACGQSEKEAQISLSDINDDLVIPANLRIEYDYDNRELKKYGIAGYARAYSGNELIVEAEALELIDNFNGGPKSIKIYERQFQKGLMVYEGFAYFRFTGSVSGQSKPEPERDQKISGRKCYFVFLAGWPEGSGRTF